MPGSQRRTPVLVGAAAVQQKVDDPRAAREPVELMIDALQAAADDAGSRDLLRRATSIRAPRGFWSYPDPCRLIAERLGAARARTEVGEIGVLQTTFFGRAARDVAGGVHDVVLVTGGEARHRTRCAKTLGIEETYAQQPESIEPDHTLRPARDVIGELEIARGLAWPVNQYSMIDNALRAAEGQSIAAHRDDLAELYAAFNAVAAANPDAWARERIDAATIRGDTGVRMMAFPYTKLHTSQWNVDQAAGFVLTSTDTARSLGIAEDRWIYPHAVVDSNLMLALSERRDVHRCAGFAEAARRVEERTGTAVGSADHLELYSCFPSAVRLQMREMQVPRDRPVTVTGGMAFAGGPLNNFAFQALAKMAEILRNGPGSTGVVTAVSGMLTKQGVSLWSTEPPANALAFDDVSEATARRSPAVDVVDGLTGEATVVTYTILYPTPEGTLVAIVEFPDQRRTIVTSADPAIARLGETEELCGRRVRVASSDRFSPI